MEIIYGKIPVINALQSKRKINSLFVSSNKKVNEIIELATKKNIKINFVESYIIDEMTNSKNNQGVCVQIEDFKYSDFDNVLSKLSKKDDALILLLDQIEDPVNFGSIIRTCAAFNCDGIVILKDRQVKVTSTVSKISTGGEEFIPICQVTNLSNAITKLKNNGFWVVSSSGNGTVNYTDIDYNRKIALVIGNEGKGISQLVLKNSDYICNIPLKGYIKALNASTATAILVSYIYSSRERSNKYER